MKGGGGEVKRKLLVTVDCEEKECGKCKWFGTRGCILFGKNQRWTKKGFRRCPACLKAEVKDGK